MAKINKHLLIFLQLLLLISPVYSAQEVEKLKMNADKIDDTDALGVPEKDSPLTRNALASDVVGRRPTPEGTPTPVKVGMYIFDISSIDDADQTFTAKIRYTLRWFDPRLISNDDQQVRKVPLLDIWSPLIRETNTRSVQKELPTEMVFVNKEGHALFVQGFDGTFTVPLNLRDFPLDRHKLYITLESFYSPEDIELIIDKELTGWNQTLSIPDWIVSNGEISVGQAFRADQERDLAQFTFSFDIERHIGFYLWKVIIPLSLIILMSWSVFYIDPKRLEAQIGLSATSILTLFAFQFTISTHLPRISYLTRMDKFTMSCSIMILFALFEAIATSYLSAIGKEDKAKSIDKFSRIAFPVAFVCMFTYSFIL